MLYKEKNSPSLDMDLFRAPTAAYRGTPFWSWNCELEKDELSRQIECLKEMGFGGFHMHSRSGMSTEYLSDTFMDLIRFCCDKAKKENMLAWLYDEDRWPSGSAGGYVTKDARFRHRNLLVTEAPIAETVSKEEAYQTGKPTLLACYEIELDADGCLKSYRRISPDAETPYIKRYAYLRTDEPSGWYNNQTYIDVLNPEAVKKFIEITYEAYKKTVGDEFDKTVPAIFTDEPQYNFPTPSSYLQFAESHDDVILPWTCDLEETFQEAYGEDIVSKIPELLWDLPNQKASQARYCFFDHICERFARAYMDQCGAWCDANGLNFTGHLLLESGLYNQTLAIGDAMRLYRSMSIPGIDILCDAIELNTAKQAQSVKNQLGREGMTSELYGVTNWDFDFRGHKFQGDWQAALGVTIRVPHLSWVSMKGSAKRDYPASINYQSPWYREYSYVEDHYARLNTVLTRGTPIVKTAVIHPIESMWLCFGPESTGSAERAKLEKTAESLTDILLTGFVDFDFISESLLPTQCAKVTDKLTVGQMQYETVIVPDCRTLRSTTLAVLEQFRAAGGKLIFIGSCPSCVDAAESDAVQALYKNSIVIPLDKNIILHTLKKEAFLTAYTATGEHPDNLISACRKDGDVRWLFIAHSKKCQTPDDEGKESLKLVLNGCFDVTLFNTVTGETEAVVYTVQDQNTVIWHTLYAYDSLLLQLRPTTNRAEHHLSAAVPRVLHRIDCKENIAYKREEENVYVLDLAAYRLDDGEMQPTEEILRIDTQCRKLLNYPAADGQDAQPWVLGKDTITHHVTLFYDVYCDCEVTGAHIAFEDFTLLKVNGRVTKADPCGFFVDRSILQYPLPELHKGLNKIEVTMPIGKRTSLECGYITGDFDVAVRGCRKTILPPSRTIGFGDLCSQGLPFYGGNLIYCTEIETPRCQLRIRANRYRGALIGVRIDGKEIGKIAYAPYTLTTEPIAAGHHTIEFVLYGTRVNTFGSLHNCGYSTWYGPTIWYTEEYGYTYEYNLRQTGILTSPVIELLELEKE